MNDKHYFIIAGSTLQYNFVQEVKEAGFIVHVFDYNPECRCAKIADYFHCISIDKKEEILKIAKKYNPVAVQTVACEVGNISACWVGEKLGLKNNSYETALNTTDKSRMKDIFAKHDIANAKYLRFNISEEINTDNISLPVVIKPADRSAGRGVTLVKNNSQLKPAIDLAYSESISKNILFEEVLTGEQYSIETISCNGEHQIVAFTEEYLDGSENFIENQQMIPARLNPADSKELERFIYKVLDVFEIKFGCCHIEVKKTSQGFKIIEIASRMGGWRDVLVKYALGVNFNKLLLDASLGIKPQIICKNNNYALVKMIFTQKEYDFYTKLKSEFPDKIVHDEVSKYNNNETKCLADAKGFYYVCIPRSEDIDYYIKGSI